MYRLTEALSVTLFILVVATIVVLSSKANFVFRLGLIAFGSLVASFALVVRPANIVVVILWIIFCIYQVWSIAREKQSPLFKSILGRVDI